MSSSSPGSNPSSPALEAGLRPGAVLEAIDGVELPRCRRNDALGGFRALGDGAQSLLRGTTGTTISLRLRDVDGQTSTHKVSRAREQGQPVTLGHLPTFFARLDRVVRNAGNGRHVAVVRFNVWMVPLAAAIDRAVDESRDADGIVIDLRGNPGGVPLDADGSIRTLSGYASAARHLADPGLGAEPRRQSANRGA